jgi:hypothetical protein
MGITFIVLAFMFVINHRWIAGFFFFVCACFMLFTWSGIEFDAELKRVKPFYMLFGLIKRGKWRSLEQFPGLTIVPVKKVYSVFSQSNRKNSSEIIEYRVYLINMSKKPEFPIKSCKNLEEAQKSMEEFSARLKLPVFSIKKH